MATTQQRIEELELIIEELGAQVRRNHVILNGDSEIAFSSGVLSRLNRIEGRFDQQSQLIQGLTEEIAKQNEQRRQEDEIRNAREEERTKVFQNMEKWVKVLGPLLVGGGGVQLLFEVSKLINGG